MSPAKGKLYLCIEREREREGGREAAREREAKIGKESLG